MTYDNNMKGVLFPNKDKEITGKKHDYSGSCEINGEEYYIVGFNNISKKGERYKSLTFYRKREPQEIKSEIVQNTDPDLPF